MGSDSIETIVVHGRVARFDVASPAFATPDSIRVGTALHSLLRFPGALGSAGEGWLYVAIPSTCGITFAMRSDRHFVDWGSDSLASLPTTMRVEEIWVHGC